MNEAWRFVSHPFVIALVPVTFALCVSGWRSYQKRRQWRREVHEAVTVALPELRDDLVSHMGNEEQLRKADQHEREQRQAIIDGQFATMRADIGKVHQRVDEIYGLLLGQNARESQR